MGTEKEEKLHTLVCVLDDVDDDALVCGRATAAAGTCFIAALIF